MLEANKKRWFEKVFSVYNRNLIKRRFHSINISGLENLDNIKSDFPLITIANHSSWWDGLILFELFSHFEFENFIMMEEKQLKDLPLFRKLGAFSIVRENHREALKSINYAAKKLRENSNTNLWIFPQGKILPNDRRPLNFYNGISKIIEKSGKCCVTPIALKFQFLNDFKPEIFVKIGNSQCFIDIDKNESKTLTESLEKDLTKLLDGIKEEIREQNTSAYKKLT